MGLACASPRPVTHFCFVAGGPSVLRHLCCESQCLQATHSWGAPLSPRGENGRAWLPGLAWLCHSLRAELAAAPNTCLLACLSRQVYVTASVTTFPEIDLPIPDWVEVCAPARYPTPEAS